MNAYRITWIVCLVLAHVLAFWGELNSGWGRMVAVVSDGLALIVFLICGFFLALDKKRSPWFALFGLLGPVGILWLIFQPRRKTAKEEIEERRGVLRERYNDLKTTMENKPN